LQDADICFFFQSDEMGSEDKKDERVIAELEYRPVSEFEAYESQAAA